MYGGRVSIIPTLINYRKIKYDMLFSLLKHAGVRGKHINYYIDLDTILDPFYSDSVISAVNSVREKEYISLSAEIINLVAHYRHFTASRLGVTSSFYFFSQNDFVRGANDNYKSKLMKRKMINHPKFLGTNFMIAANVKILTMISLYIPDCYFIPSGKLESAVIPYYMINNHNDYAANFILSDNKNFYQLCSDIDRVYVLRAIGAKSKLIAEKDVINTITNAYKNKPFNKLDASFYLAFLSLNGYKELGIQKIDNLTPKKILFDLDEKISNGLIKNEYVKSPHNIYNNDLDNEEGFIENYRTLDIRRQFRKLSKADILSIEQHLINRFDSAGLIKLNDMYFEGNNMQLQELLEGVRRLE